MYIYIYVRYVRDSVYLHPAPFLRDTICWNLRRAQPVIKNGAWRKWSSDSTDNFSTWCRNQSEYLTTRRKRSVTSYEVAALPTLFGIRNHIRQAVAVAHEIK